MNLEHIFPGELRRFRGRPIYWQGPGWYEFRRGLFGARWLYIKRPTDTERLTYVVEGDLDD